MNIENASFKIKPGLAPGTQVYALLQEEIATIRIPPGTALSEKMLAERLGVSRTPVREALIRLSEDGLVYIVPKSGTFVSPIDVDAVLDAHLIRESLLCATVFLAARNATPEDVANLRADLELQHAHIAADKFDDFLEADDVYHCRIIEISGRRGVLKPVKAAKLQLDRVRYSTIENSAHIQLILQQHTQIVDCIEKKDGRGARRVMREHLHLFLDKVDQLVKNHKILINSADPGTNGRRARRRA